MHDDVAQALFSLALISQPPIGEHLQAAIAREEKIPRTAINESERPFPVIVLKNHQEGSHAVSY